MERKIVYKSLYFCVVRGIHVVYEKVNTFFTLIEYLILGQSCTLPNFYRHVTWCLWNAHVRVNIDRYPSEHLVDYLTESIEEVREEPGAQGAHRVGLYIGLRQSLVGSFGTLELLPGTPSPPSCDSGACQVGSFIASLLSHRQFCIKFSVNFCKTF